MTEQSKGIWAMVGACLIWSTSPLYFKLLAHIPTIEILAHRIVWSLVTFALILMVQGRLGQVRIGLSNFKTQVVILLAALMISLNWFVFIYAIQVGHAVEASLGYYIFPLVAVMFGWLVFGEKLLPAQWVAVALAALAVGTLAFGLGVAPWISLILATSFGLYGLIKKSLDVGPVVSVTCEVLLLLPVALAVLIWQGSAGVFGWNSDSALLLFSGLLTAGPLILFSYATKRATMATVGLVQYLNPTGQFLIAVLVFQEPFGKWHLIAFAMIWFALIIYSLAALRQQSASRRARVRSEAEAQVLMNPLSDSSAKP